MWLEHKTPNKGQVLSLDPLRNQDRSFHFTLSGTGPGAPCPTPVDLMWVSVAVVDGATPDLDFLHSSEVVLTVCCSTSSLVPPSAPGSQSVKASNGSVAAPEPDPDAVTMAKLTKLEGVMIDLMKVFQDYAGKEGHIDTLSNAEVKALIEEELPTFAQVGAAPS